MAIPCVPAWKVILVRLRSVAHTNLPIVQKITTVNGPSTAIPRQEDASQFAKAR